MADSRGWTLPLRVGAAMRCEEYGAFGLAWKSALELRGSYERAERYARVLTNVSTYEVEPTEGGAFMHLHRGGERRLGLRLSNEATIASIVSISQQASSGEFRPLAVYFKHPAPVMVADHEIHFGCPVHFGSERDALLVSEETLGTPNKVGDPDIVRFFDTVLEADLSKFGDDSLQRRVQRRISRSLSEGVPTISDVARQLGMSGRTLQRRLSEQGLTYQALVDEAAASPRATPPRADRLFVGRGRVHDRVRRAELVHAGLQALGGADAALLPPRIFLASPSGIVALGQEIGARRQEPNAPALLRFSWSMTTDNEEGSKRWESLGRRRTSKDSPWFSEPPERPGEGWQPGSRRRTCRSGAVLAPAYRHSTGITSRVGMRAWTGSGRPTSPTRRTSPCRARRTPSGRSSIGPGITGSSDWYCSRVVVRKRRRLASASFRAAARPGRSCAQAGFTRTSPKEPSSTWCSPASSPCPRGTRRSPSWTLTTSPTSRSRRSPRPGMPGRSTR